jgi:hypothetical protein
MASVFAGAVINFWHLAYDKVFTDRVSFSYFGGGPHDVHAGVGAQGAEKRHREVHRRDVSCAQPRWNPIAAETATAVRFGTKTTKNTKTTKSKDHKDTL